MQKSKSIWMCALEIQQKECDFMSFVRIDGCGM
jgi:hypothetical protein